MTDTNCVGALSSGRQSEDVGAGTVAHVPTAYFPAWKTLFVGGQRLLFGYGFLGMLRRERCNMSGIARRMLCSSDFQLSQIPSTVELVALSTADLGFTNDVTLRDIIDHAQVFGLMHCPHETAPLLRMEYKYQLRGELLVVVTEAIELYGDDLRIFALTRDYIDRWLLGIDGNPNNTWSTRVRFVFMRRPAPIPSFLWSV